MNIIEKIKESRRHKEEEDRVFETIEEIIDEREERGEQHLVDARELPMLKNLFRLRDVRVKDIMIPRVDISAADVNMTPSAFCKYVLKEKFTRYPVYETSLDNVVGVIHVKDILFCLIQKKRCVLKKIMTPQVLFISPAMRALDLLKEMQSNQIQMAIVVDEHGGTDGIVSLEDILEVLVGEIDDEHDDPEELLTRVDAQTIRASAKAKLADFEKIVGPVASKEEREDIETLGGWVVQWVGRVPAKGEVVIHPKTKLKFLILSSTPSHIQRMEITNFLVKEEAADDK